MRTPAWLQRLESRIALALARADAGTTAQAAGAHHVEVLNAAPVAPAGFFIFAAPAFTTLTGHVRVTLYWNVNANGGTAAVGDGVQLLANRDGTALGLLGITLGVFANANQLTPDAMGMAYSYEDTVAAGSTHAWGGEASISGGHTFGCSAAGLLKIQIQDLPG